MPPVPNACPVGGAADSCHGGPFCSLETCSSDDDCNAGQVCQSTQLCVGKIDCAGGFTPVDAGASFVTTVEGTCEQGQACAATCETHKVCVPKPGPVVIESDCGCRLVGGHVPSRWDWLLLVAVVGGGLRRWRRAG